VRTVFPSTKFVFNVRPHPNLLPQEKEPAAHASLFPADCPANPVASISKDAASVISLSSEERAGVRTVVNPIFPRLVSTAAYIPATDAVRAPAIR
jgi:hypothetical protein